MKWWRLPINACGEPVPLDEGRSGLKPRVTPEGKAQADPKAQQPRQDVSMSRDLQRRYRAADGVMKPRGALLRGQLAPRGAENLDTGPGRCYNAFRD